MATVKTLMISLETHRRLMNLKKELGVSSMDKLLNLLLDQAEITKK